MKGTAELGEKPIGLLLWRYSLPGVVAMVVNAIYNVLDRVFIGKFSGEAALAGLTVAFPMMMLTFAVANLVGEGGGVIAIRFGEKDLKGASHVFGNVITSTALIGLLVTVVGLVNLSGWLRIFGADATTLPFAHDFMQIILLGTTFQFLSFTLSNTVRTEGFPRLAMMSQITSVLVNLVLALIFVAGLRWGVRGAAMSTVLGQLCGLGVVLPHYLRKKSILKPAHSDWRLDWKLFIQKDSTTMPIAVHGMRIFMAMLPAIAINLMSITYFQSTCESGHGHLPWHGPSVHLPDSVGPCFFGIVRIDRNLAGRPLPHSRQAST